MCQHLLILKSYGSITAGGGEPELGQRSWHLSWAVCVFEVSVEHLLAVGETVENPHSYHQAHPRFNIPLTPTGTVAKFHRLQK